MATKELQLIGVRLVNDEDYGKSAYEIALDNGFEGTEAEWLESLKGKDGADGKDGKDGADGIDGEAGHTPVKGVDYYTPEERDTLQRDMVSEIAKQLNDRTALFDLTGRMTWSEENVYETTTGATINLAGCNTYTINIYESEVPLWIGKTVRIKTYAYGDMAAFLHNDVNGFHLLNPTADIINNPASGVCEFEFTISETPLDDWVQFRVPFVENNGYTKLEVYLVNGIVWEENDTIPPVTASDAGKFLRVNADGKWEVESVHNAEEVAY